MRSRRATAEPVAHYEPVAIVSNFFAPHTLLFPKMAVVLMCTSTIGSYLMWMLCFELLYSDFWSSFNTC